MATQSRLLTGSLTGTGRWNAGGDASFEEQKERKAAAQNARSRSRKACQGQPKGSTGVVGIKTDNAIREMISLKGATPLKSSDMSLVAGNVTGGGGKATRKTT